MPNWLGGDFSELGGTSEPPTDGYKYLSENATKVERLREKLFEPHPFNLDDVARMGANQTSLALASLGRKAVEDPGALGAVMFMAGFLQGMGAVDGK